MELRLATNVECSTNNRAKCRNCRRRICKGEPRVSMDYKWKQYTFVGYYCCKCGLEQLKNDKKILEETNKNFSKMINLFKAVVKENKEAIEKGDKLNKSEELVRAL